MFGFNLRYTEIATKVCRTYILYSEGLILHQKLFGGLQTQERLLDCAAQRREIFWPPFSKDGFIGKKWHSIMEPKKTRY